MWNGTKKTTIRAAFLPYIHDVAFQSLIVRRAFPEYSVSSWLMLPDRGKIRRGANDSTSFVTSEVPTVQDTMDAINTSTASLINVDDLVEVALTSKVSFPGSNDESFEEVIEIWAEKFCYQEELEQAFFDLPLGSHCASCQYRIKHVSDREPLSESNQSMKSGFNVCWQKATSLGPDNLKQPLIVDLYGYSKRAISKFLCEKKFTLEDLSTDDFKSTKDEPDDKISALERQWYQVSSLRVTADKPRYVMKRDRIRHEMQNWPYPWHFVDFESSSPVLPYYNGMAPYEIFAFQFSHHIIYNESDRPEHEVYHATEFLHAERGSCPSEPFLHALHNAICTDGTVFQWSTFENTVLTSLLSSKALVSSLEQREVDTLSALLSNGSRPMIDLCKLASDYYYVDGSGGSSSIKRLLAPTMNVSSRLKHLYGAPTYNSNNFKDFQWYRESDGGKTVDPYKILAEMKPDYCGNLSSVGSGGDAATAFHVLQSSDMSEQDRQQIKKSLLRYCELDTLSMAMIVQAWQGFLEDE
jgi:hypothetical protein